MNAASTTSGARTAAGSRHAATARPTAVDVPTTPYIPYGEPAEGPVLQRGAGPVVGHAGHQPADEQGRGGDRGEVVVDELRPDALQQDERPDQPAQQEPGRRRLPALRPGRRQRRGQQGRPRVEADQARHDVIAGEPAVLLELLGRPRG